MPTVKVKDLIDRVAITLQDRTNVRWPRVDLLTYLNDAQRQIVLHRPDANAVNTAFACLNASKQTLPAAALRLLTIKRNVGGRSITQISQDTLDIQLPDWHQEAAVAGVEHFIYDPLDPKTFYLYPVPAAAHSIEIVYSTAPLPINDELAGTTIGLDDIYANVIMDYMLYRSYQKDATYGDIQKAALYLQAFNSALGIKTQVDGAIAARAAQGAQ
jgi:hypothetical protein